MGTILELGKDKAAKEEGWALLSSAVPKTHWASAHMAIWLWDTFTFFRAFFISKLAV